MAGRVKRKPHTQIGQKGKGSNKPKPRPQPPLQTGGLPFQAGQMPKPPPQIGNFLPSTPSFARGQSTINDARSQAQNRFDITTGMIKPQMDLDYARLDTDQALAGRRLDENMAERGVFTSGFRPKLYQEQVATPFGRQRQDIASRGAQQYADASLGYGDALVGLGGQEFNLFNDTAQETASQPYLGFDLGGYQVPNQPGPYFSSPQPGGGRTRPSRNRNRNGGRRGRR
jgi:hypothetical protein